MSDTNRDDVFIGRSHDTRFEPMLFIQRQIGTADTDFPTFERDASDFDRRPARYDVGR